MSLLRSSRLHRVRRDRCARRAVEETLRDGQGALAALHPGARFQYVFHGSSGSSEQELRDAVRYGVVKVNVDTDMQYAFTRAVADHVEAHGVSDKKHFDPPPGDEPPKPPWHMP